MPDHDTSSDQFDDQTAEDPQTDEYVGAYDKLVRDDIPDVVRADGNHPVTRRVDGREYERYLAKKLREEAQEYADAMDADAMDANARDADTMDADAMDADGNDAEYGASDDVLDELADVHAVFEAIVDASEHSMPAIRDRARDKASVRGGFDDGIVLERIDPGDD